MAMIAPVQSYTPAKSAKKSHMSGEFTGLTAGGGMVLTIASGYTKNKNFKKQHKNIAIATAIITAAHVLLPKLAYRKGNNQ